MADLFDCSSCSSQEIELSLTQQGCVVCRSIDCHQCLDDDGNCVPCK